MHASNRDDPLLEIQDDVNYLLVFFSLHKYDYIQGEDSDADDFFIRPDDNLVVAAHIEDDTSSLEVYGEFYTRTKFQFSNENILVYNDKEGYLYVHHDILMLNMPLCLTWLDYDTNNPNAGLSIEDRIFLYMLVCFS